MPNPAARPQIARKFTFKRSKKKTTQPETTHFPPCEFLSELSISRFLTATFCVPPPSRSHPLLFSEGNNWKETIFLGLRATSIVSWNQHFKLILTENEKSQHNRGKFFKFSFVAVSSLSFEWLLLLWYFVYGINLNNHEPANQQWERPNVEDLP